MISFCQESVKALEHRECNLFTFVSVVPNWVADTQSPQQMLDDWMNWGKCDSYRGSLWFPSWTQNYNGSQQQNGYRSFITWTFSGMHKANVRFQLPFLSQFAFPHSPPPSPSICSALANLGKPLSASVLPSPCYYFSFQTCVWSEIYLNSS